MMASACRRVLIVDDHPEFGAFAHALLDAEGWDVVGEAADAAEALRAVRELRPELVLLDIQLPDRDGFAVAEELARDPSPPVVVLMSSRQAADYGARLRDARARGFLPKTELSGAALAALALAG
jgi:DNA-binding NarL/FixJ family response regulator